MLQSARKEEADKRSNQYEKARSRQIDAQGAQPPYPGTPHENPGGKGPRFVVSETDHGHGVWDHKNKEFVEHHYGRHDQMSERPYGHDSKYHSYTLASEAAKRWNTMSPDALRAHEARRADRLSAERKKSSGNIGGQDTPSPKEREREAKEEKAKKRPLPETRPKGIQRDHEQADRAYNPKKSGPEDTPPSPKPGKPKPKSPYDGNSDMKRSQSPDMHNDKSRDYRKMAKGRK
jgi:hypothetical protein